MKSVNVNTVPYLKSLASCLRRVVSEGYTEDFSVQDLTLASSNTNLSYPPQQVSIINSFRFADNSDTTDGACLYLIETVDGHKGTLVDDKGTLTQFIQEFITTARHKLGRRQ